MNDSTTAVLTLDIQDGLLDLAPEARIVVPAAERVLRCAREHSMLIIHVGLGFEPGYPEIPTASPIWGKLRDLRLFEKGSPSARFVGSLRDPADTVIYKQRVSAFTDTPLDLILRSQDITTVVLMGISTSHVVFSTLRSAIEKDYACVIIQDGCFDTEPALHDILIDKVFAREATVVTAAEFTNST